MTGKIHCDNCGNGYPSRYRFCPVDGAELKRSAPRSDSLFESLFFLRSSRWEREIRVAGVFSVLACFLLGVFSASGIILYRNSQSPYGSLVVKTSPRGALIFIDGINRGHSPLVIRELSGAHRIEAVMPGFKYAVERIQLTPYSTKRIDWTLQPLLPEIRNKAQRNEILTDVIPVHNGCAHQNPIGEEYRLGCQGVA